jgi:nitrogen-specific signal transduction histidine kinase
MTRVIAHPSRERANQGLWEGLVLSETLHRGFVETLAGCIICVDVDGTIGFANRHAAKLWESNGVPLEGQSILALPDVGGQGQLTQVWRAAANGESVHDVETVHEVDDRVHTIRWSVRPLTHADFATYDSAEMARPNASKWAVLAIGVDVTDRLERERQKAEDDAMSILAALTTGLAHEIRNPLNAAKLQLELLLLRAKLAGDGPWQERLITPATLVRTAIGRLSTLFEEFLYVRRSSTVSSCSNNVC